MNLINRAAVRRMALELSVSNRAGKFKRVGKSFLDRIEAATRASVAREVQSHPSKGKTLL